MSHSNPQPLTILIPFSFPPAEFREDLGRQLRLPGLALATSRPSGMPRRHTFDSYASALPHERWLMQAIPGVATLPATLAAARGLKNGHWKLLQPSHIHVARDHLVLTDARRLELNDTESRALLAQVRPWAEEVGCELHYIDPLRWLIRNDRWNDLTTCTPDSACGHNIDIWMPKGERAREWRRLHNEIQMSWHDSALNQQREQRRLDPVNALWLWGAETGAATDRLLTGDFSYDEKDAALSLPAQWQIAESEQADGLPTLSGTESLPALITADGLSSSALAGDWGNWSSQFETIDQTLIEPALQWLKAGRITRLTLILSDHETLVSYRLTASALGILGTLRKLGQKPSLKSYLRAGSQTAQD